MGDSLVRSRMRIRNILNNGWDDLADSEVFVRDPDNLDWIRLVPGEFSIRNQTNSGWIDIDNEAEPDIDDPCARMTLPGSCNGGIEDKEMGSGDGMGSGGAEWEQVAGYPAGYDMPDAGLAGFGVEPVDMWPTGFALRRTGAETVESYDDAPVAAYNGDASYANPAPAWTSVFGRGAAITEFIYMLGQTPGYVDLTWVCWEQFGMSVDIYYLGIRRGTSCGKKTGRGRLRFYYDPAEGNGEERIMVRVRCNEAGRWALHCRAPSELLTTEVNNLRPDYYKPYAITSMPDVLSPHYLGTPIFPAPCHAAVYVKPERLSMRGHFEYYHHVGELAGWMYLDFKSWNNKDFVEVYHYGRRIATTLDPESGRGYLKFYFDPTQNQCQDIVVRVVSEDFAETQPDGSKPDATSVYYGLWCPETRGAREFRHPCGAYEVTSAGHPTTEDNFDLQGVHAADICGVLINCTAGNQKAKFEVFDVNDNLLDTQIVEAGQTGNLEYWAPIGDKYVRYPRVHVTSGIGCNWRYFVHCPIQKPDIEVPSVIVPFTCIETPPQPPVPPPSDYDGRWKLVVDVPGGANAVGYPWKNHYEYCVVVIDQRGQWEICPRFFHIVEEAFQIIGAPGKYNGDMFWDTAGRDTEVTFFRSNAGDPATGEIRCRGGIVVAVLERPFHLHQRGTPLNSDVNEWEMYRLQRGFVETWEHGYEYVVFSWDWHGVTEVAQMHFLIPKSEHSPKFIPNGSGYIRDFSNATDFELNGDHTMRSQRSDDTSTMCVLRRPLFMSYGADDKLGWQHDYLDQSTSTPQGGWRTFPWQWGREYSLANVGWRGAVSNHRLMTHQLLLRSGHWHWWEDGNTAGIASKSMGWVEMSVNGPSLDDPATRGIHSDGDAGPMVRMTSRPFWIEGIDN